MNGKKTQKKKIKIFHDPKFELQELPLVQWRNQNPHSNKETKGPTCDILFEVIAQPPPPAPVNLVWNPNWQAKLVTRSNLEWPTPNSVKQTLINVDQILDRFVKLLNRNFFIDLRVAVVLFYSFCRRRNQFLHDL